MGSRANRSGILSFTSLTSVAAIFSGSCRSTKWKSELGSAPLMSGIWPRRIRWVSRAIQPRAFRGHAAQQHLKEALRHKTNLVAERNSHRQATDVPLGTLILGANDQPFTTAKSQLSGVAVVAVVPRSDDV